MGHTAYINTAVWDILVKQAAARKTRPSRLIDLYIRRGIGLEPELRVAGTPEALEEETLAEAGEEAGVRLIGSDSEDNNLSPLLGNIKEIRKWQDELQAAKEEYEGYRNGVAEEDWELEQRSDYVVACADRIEIAQLQLEKLIKETGGVV